jgi:transcriptional regulator with XRE-family HTH domain
VKAQQALGVNVRKQRLEREMTQEQLGQLCGMTLGAISRVERGKRDLRLSSIVRLAKGLEVEALELMRGV